MNALLRLPRWLAGAFLLFSIPACVAETAIAYNCSTIPRWAESYSVPELRQMARDHGYSEVDIVKAEACLPAFNAKKQDRLPQSNLEVGKRSPTLPPVHTAKPKPKAATPVPTPAPAPAPVVVPEPVVEATPAPAAAAPPAPSWGWDFLEYLGFIILVGSALGLLVNFGGKVVKNYKATKEAHV